MRDRNERLAAAVGNLAEAFEAFDQASFLGGGQDEWADFYAALEDVKDAAQELDYTLEWGEALDEPGDVSE